MKRLSKDIKKQIVELYRDGWTKKWIAESLNISVSSVVKVLRLSGTDPLLFRNLVWDRALDYYVLHYESRIKLAWVKLTNIQRLAIYKEVLPMCRAEAAVYLKELGFPDIKEELSFLKEENRRLKHMLALYLLRG